MAQLLSLGRKSPSQSCQITDRKKRRGIIEKRRRDRINSSLSELRRLVPSAFEKQGSAKLEKAEILQMTVDHLKLLHQKGITGYNCDPHAVAMDYRYVGFRECAAEVARYLVAVEGLDLQDPLRMRLLSHLQCYSAQREAAAKATLQPVPPAWPPAPPAMHPVPVPSFNAQYGAMVPTGGQASSTQGTDAHSVMTSHAASSSSASSVLNVFSDSRHMAGDASGGLGSLTAHHARGGPAVAMTTTSSAAASQPQAMSPPLIHSLPQFHASQFPPQSIMPSASHAPYSHAHSAHAQSAGLHPSASVKPYRPWGGELAY